MAGDNIQTAVDKSRSPRGGEKRIWRWRRVDMSLRLFTWLARVDSNVVLVVAFMFQSGEKLAIG